MSTTTTTTAENNPMQSQSEGSPITHPSDDAMVTVKPTAMDLIAASEGNQLVAGDNTDADGKDKSSLTGSGGETKNKNKKDKQKKASKKKVKQEKKAKNKKENKCTNSKQQSADESKETDLVNESAATMSPPTDGGGGVNSNKPKLMVEELKLFQNNNLLNQQDPMQNLHLQLNQYINSDTVTVKAGHKNANGHQLPALAITDLPSDFINQRPDIDGRGGEQAQLNVEPAGDTCSTIKKGVLWQQQSYDKFHQRLFNRWKKRYFILTTDYLVCFKRSLSKVGRSEMGKFLYKTSLGDMLKVDWVKPNKSDKGSIILYLNGRFNLHLWAKDSLDEWMFMIKESISRYQARRSYIPQNGTATILAYKDLQSNENGAQEVLYENTCVTNLQNSQQIVANNTSESTRSHNNSNGQVSGESPKPRKRPSKQQLVSSTKPASSSTNSVERQVEDNQEETRKDPSSVNEAKPAESDPVINDSVGHSKTDDASKDSLNHKTPGPIVVSGERISNNEDISSSERKHGPATNNLSCATANQPIGEQAELARMKQSRSSFRRSGDSTVDKSNELASGRRIEATNRQSSLGEKSEPQQRLTELDGTTSTGNAGADSSTNQRATTDGGDATREPSDCNNDNDGAGTNQARAESNRRPTTNLIRRDDSWQSLVSLTRVGRAPNAMQARAVAQRSLYAQHIMPHSVDGGGGPKVDNIRGPMAHGGSSGFSGLVESTVTPVRAGPFRQHSIQSYSSQRKTPSRAFHHQPTTAASFDAPPSSRHQQQQQQPRTPVSVSYQQKLLQLQLLHNSNNVDYIRQQANNVAADNNNNNSAAPTNDYQIYGPESTVYGYSSMRSNLKSAASEFSFIRPSSSGHIQSTLPHQNSAHVLDQATGLLRHQQPAPHEAVFARSPSVRAQLLASQHHQLRDTNNNLIANGGSQQFFLDPNTGEQLPVQLLQQQLQSELIAPMRELPLKPNKKRSARESGDPNVCNNAKSLPKSSSLTSSIACFFRRAFSRRSKRRSKRRPKLAESCSSSLGAFENENFAGVPIVPSAFSTGSKSVDGRNMTNEHSSKQKQQRNNQPQRMVDMIEAFTSKNFADHQAANINRPPVMIDDSHLRPGRDFHERRQQQQQQQQDQINQQYMANVTPARLPHQQSRANQSINQFSSPLHKSNSISATMGLSLVDKSAIGKRASFIYDNELRALQQAGGSPVLPRSAKVLSANLTPLRDPMNQYQHQHHRLSVLSPLNGNRHGAHGEHHQMPRPSSIYGQPSMIANGGSPVINRAIEEWSANLNLQRNSLHGYNIKTQPELLRGQLLKAHHHLGTTQEESAEQLSSPHSNEAPKSAVATIISQNHPELTGQYDNRSHIIANGGASGHYISRAEALSMMTASPSNGTNLNRPTPQHRRAVVNPILQSPTMDTIYDNHPMMLNFTGDQSHYDNHQAARLGPQQSPMVRRAKTSNSMIQFYPPDDLSQTIAENPYSSKRMTPSHHRTNGLLLPGNNKPAAIVAPSTPNHPGMSHTNNNYIENLNRSNHVGPILDNGSPLVHRRNVSYQQSPLIDRAKPRNPIYSTGNLGGQQSMAVNIAGAPGINLDPALAASLLKGTNIDAYESSTFNRNSNSGQSYGDTSKTFLVSTRLSKSMAQHQQSSSQSTNTGGSSSSAGDTFRRSSKVNNGEELSSSAGSQSINSSRSHSSSRANHSSSRRKISGSNGPCNSSQEEEVGDSSSMESNRDRLGQTDERRKNSSAGSSCSSGSSRPGRGSKTNRQWESEQSDIADSLDGRKSMDNERNWITSKLVSRQQ